MPRNPLAQRIKGTAWLETPFTPEKYLDPRMEIVYC